MPDRRRRNPQERGGGADGEGAVDADDDGPLSRPYTDPDAAPDPPSDPTSDPASGPAADESDAARRRRRAQFLRELNEAKALRERVKPRQARAARMRQQMRMRTFRW